MCTEDCACYAGQGDIYKKMWKDYGDKVLNEFKRNAGSRAKYSPTGAQTLPLIFSSDK